MADNNNNKKRAISRDIYMYFLFEKLDKTLRVKLRNMRVEK